MLIKIEKDLFNIAQRIKNIDIGYFICFNTKNKKFEVHNKNQARGTYSATIPFNKLDSRAIDYLNETHVRNYKQIFKAIDENNKKLDQKIKEVNDDKVKYRVDEIYNYSRRYSKTPDFDFEKNLWV